MNYFIQKKARLPGSVSANNSDKNNYARALTDNRSSSVAQLGKKKDDWRTGKIDKEFDAAKKGAGAQKIDADTGHHKISKSKLKKFYESLSEADRRKLNAELGIEGVKGLLSMRSNLTFGPNSSLRTDDPGDQFDPNYTPTGAMTPRSHELHAADRIMDKPKLSQKDIDAAFKRLKDAEAIHGSDKLDTDTSMWVPGKRKARVTKTNAAGGLASAAAAVGGGAMLYSALKGTALLGASLLGTGVLGGGLLAAGLVGGAYAASSMFKQTYSKRKSR